MAIKLTSNQAMFISMMKSEGWMSMSDIVWDAKSRAVGGSDYQSIDRMVDYPIRYKDALNKVGVKSVKRKTNTNGVATTYQYRVILLPSQNEQLRQENAKLEATVAELKAKLAKLAPFQLNASDIQKLKRVRDNYVNKGIYSSVLDMYLGHYSEDMGGSEYKRAKALVANGYLMAKLKKSSHLAQRYALTVKGKDLVLSIEKSFAMDKTALSNSRVRLPGYERLI